MTSEDRLRVLIVDDNRLTVRLLAAAAAAAGYESILAYDGAEATALLAQEAVDVVITDWEMPGCTGLELVETVRTGEREPYRYLIMITQHGDSDHRARGLAAGADDFLTKPVDHTEVQARLRVARRIVGMARTLAAQRDELARSHARLTAELDQAARVQTSLLPRVLPEIPGWSFAWRLQSCDQLAGDSLGLVRLDQRHLVAYVFDVTGHGVTAALLATQVSRALSPEMGPESVLTIATGEGSERRPALPSEVLSELNRRFPMELEMPQLIAAVYLLIEVDSGRITWASAANPPPFLLATGRCLARDLQVDPFVGTLPGTVYEDHVADIPRGGRLYLLSDGLGEAMDPQRQLFEDERIAHSLEGSAAREIDASVEQLLTAVEVWTGGAGPSDDRAVLAIERHG